MQKYIWLVVKLGISAAILGGLFNAAYKNKQFEGLFDSEKEWSYLILALASCLGAHVVSYYRWHIMARSIGFALSAWEAIKIGLIGTFFNLVAFGVVGGDSLRAFYAARQSKEKVPEAISSVFADRFIGLMSMFGVAIVAFNLCDFNAFETVETKKLAALQYAFRVVTVCFCLGVAGLVLLFFSPKLREFAIVKRIESVSVLGAVVTRILNVIALYQKKPGVILICVGLSVLTNALFVASVFFAACGLTEAYPSFANHFVVVPISLVANAVPLPGGLGGMEFALTFLYTIFTDQSDGVEAAGFVVAIGFRFAILFVSVIGCLFWVVYRNHGLDLSDPSDPKKQKQK